jgi:hypothetical protein
VGDGKSNSLFYILLTVQFDCQYSIFFFVFSRVNAMKIKV